MCLATLAENDLKFGALESLNNTHGAFSLVEKKKEEREGRRKRLYLGWIRRTRSTASMGSSSEAQCI
jgi:hypothetical protein